ncbi:hypothetical protein [Nitratireductor sp. XY-223]|uniref:hypothetical protein n=1 Tax=Nitratireductor sp. XY-223 TaxID=2561926 RepID=UPI0010AAF6C7|nr:hypothetical protein [Nitratireductor sp. XY-223]
MQNGQDDGREYPVGRTQLEKLLRTVNAVLNASRLVNGRVKNGEVLQGDKWVPQYEKGKVIADPTLAKELLPTAEGFFFGSTDYDKWYVEDLKLTKSILEEALAKPELDYYYSSWW